MLGPDFPDLPSHETIADAILVAGPAALDTDTIAGLGGTRLARVGLSRSGVRRPDGGAVPLAATAFRNRRIGPAESDLLPAVESRLAGRAIYGGVMGPAFGHQITQSVGRLWAGDLDTGAPILFLAERLSFTAIPGHFIDLARSLGVRNDLQLVTGPMQYESLLVPAEVCNLDKRPCTTPFFRNWLAERRPLPQGDGPDLYVSRSRLPLGGGQYLQEHVLERALAQCGYRVIHPETMTVSAQLEALSSARRLVFADGSAAHMWSFAARPGQQVAVVMRRPRDHKFARWFRSFDVPPPVYVDHGLADFWSRGEGPRRSIALLDLRAVWEDLRRYGFHDHTADLGPDRASLEAWLDRLSPPRLSADAPPPPGLDQRSIELLALRGRFSRRAPPSALPPAVSV